MTVSVKLEPDLEAQLRRRAAAMGRTQSEVIRAALVAYLEDEDVVPARSAHALGASLFGRHRGAPDLAEHRKRELVELWSAKRSSGRR
jgi:predicted transcriptional regulator